MKLLRIVKIETFLKNYIYIYVYIKEGKSKNNTIFCINKVIYLIVKVLNKSFDKLI